MDLIVLLDNVEGENVGQPIGDVPYQLREVTQPPLKVGGGDASCTANAHGGLSLMNTMEEVFVGNKIDHQAAIKKKGCAVVVIHVADEVGVDTGVVINLF